MSKDPINYAHWAYSNYSSTPWFVLSGGKMHLFALFLVCFKMKYLLSTNSKWGRLEENQTYSPTPTFLAIQFKT